MPRMVPDVVPRFGRRTGLEVGGPIRSLLVESNDGALVDLEALSDAIALDIATTARNEDCVLRRWVQVNKRALRWLSRPNFM
jgi:hypothetical protein